MVGIRETMVQGEERGCWGLKTGHFTSLFNSENLTSLKLPKVQFLCVFLHMGNPIFVAQKKTFTKKISKLQFWFD